MRNLTKIIIAFMIVFILFLGINYQPRQYFDYSSVDGVEEVDGVSKVDFLFLGGFRYEGNSEEIPEPVLRLDGRMIEITGYMLPVETDRGRVKSFLLVNSRLACCFGVMPRTNEFIFAKVREGRGVLYHNDVPVTVKGILDVGSDNVVSSLYTLEVDTLRTDG